MFGIQSVPYETVFTADLIRARTLLLVLYLFLFVCFIRSFDIALPAGEKEN